MRKDFEISNKLASWIYRIQFQLEDYLHDKIPRKKMAKEMAGLFRDWQIAHLSYTSRPPLSSRGVLKNIDLAYKSLKGLNINPYKSLKERDEQLTDLRLRTPE